MAEPVADSKLPVAVSFGLVAVGLIIGLIGGFTKGSWLGGIVAALGRLPGHGRPVEGRPAGAPGTLGLSVVAVLVSLGVGGLLIVLASSTTCTERDNVRAPARGGVGCARWRRSRRWR